MTTIFCMIEVLMKNRVVIPRRWETDLLGTTTFAELFQSVATDYKDHPVTAEIGTMVGGKEPRNFVQVSLHQKISLLELQGANFVKFKVTQNESDSPSCSTDTKKNAFDILCSASKTMKLPQKKNEINKKAVLFNNILDAIKDENDIGFRSGTAETTGKQFINFLCDLIWYIDPQRQTLKDQGFVMPHFIKKVYQVRSGRDLDDLIPYFDYIAEKKAKPRMSQDELLSLANRGYSFLNTVWLSDKRWNWVKKDLEYIVNFIKKYQERLLKVNKSMNFIHSLTKSARNPIEDGQCYTREANDTVIPELADLDAVVRDLNVYEPALLNDNDCVSKLDKKAKYDLFRRLIENSLSLPFVYFKYSPQAGLCTYHFIWVLPDREHRDEAMYAKLTAQIAKNIPTFHSRAMRSEFREHFSSIVTAKPAILNEMYRYLTGDERQPEDKISKDVASRLHVALTSDDEHLAYDLREMNQGRPEKYNAFWEGLNQVLERDFPAATEERRHGENVYLPVATSIKDLTQKVLQLKPGIEVPSESWILLQFTPKNSRYHTALNYTSRFEIVYKLQSRSHHTNHPDTYYCMAQFKILREFAIKYREFSQFFSEDDKHGVNIGEPGTPLATVLRNRKVMMVKGFEPKASDHDWHRFKLVPSVLLQSGIPEDITGSFYSGVPYVTLKDAIFQKSSPLRHQAEKEKAIDPNGTASWKPIECTFSDGGPDHNPRYASVEIAQLAHFLKNDLDMSAAAVSYPGGSYTDPAERIMPLLNIAMYGVSLERSLMQPVHETKLKNVNTMEEIRKICKDDPELTIAVKDSIKQCIDKLNERYPAVSLKGVPIKIGEVASAEEIQLLFDEVNSIDDSLDPSMTSQQEVKKCTKLVDYLKDHSLSRKYIFQLRKCDQGKISMQNRLDAIQILKDSNLSSVVEAQLENAITSVAKTTSDLREITNISSDANVADVSDIVQKLSVQERQCNSCRPPRLPLKEFLGLHWVPDPMPRTDDNTKFKHFSELYGTETKEIFRPTYVEDLDAAIKAFLVTSKVRENIRCVGCSKPRVIYSEAKVWKTESDSVKCHVESIFYECGAVLFPEGHRLHKIVNVKQMLKCKDPIELQYFANQKVL